MCSCRIVRQTLRGLSTSIHMQLADAAQKWIGVKCFQKEHYPVPEHAFTAVSEQVLS